MITPYDPYNYKKKKRRYYYGQTELELIDAIQCGLISSVYYTFFRLPIVLREYFKKQGPKKFEKSIKRLEGKGIVHLSGEIIKLTKKGKELAKMFQLEKITIQSPAKWDKTWRLISYDIPEKLKNERMYFQRSLKKLNFRKIHESLWVYPHECEEEVALIAFNLKVSEYVVHMITNHLPNQEKMEKAFSLN